jgi:hypothetical protein
MIFGQGTDFLGLFGGDPFGAMAQTPWRTPGINPTAPPIGGGYNMPSVNPIAAQRPDIFARLNQRAAASGLNLGDLGLALLANSGYSPNKRSFGEILGQSALGAKQMGAQREESDLNRRLREAQIRQLDEAPKQDLKAIIGPDGNPMLVPASEAAYKQPYMNAANAAEPPADQQLFEFENKQRAAAGLKPFKTLSEWKAQYMPKYGELGGIQTLLNAPGGPRQLGTLEAELEAQREKAGAGATGKATAERFATQIDTGLDAADSIATVRRGLELLDSVKTGGIDAAKLKATNLFGVTGADEAELSSNLGKAVLSQLRATFGAQFTEREGARLAEIEAGFGKSTEGNRRLLQQAEKILERAARRGIHAAEQTGDSFAADEIKKSMGFTLSTEPTDTKTINGKTYVKRGDKWYEQ